MKNTIITGFVLAVIYCLNVMNINAQTVPVRIVSYNLLNFPNGRNDCGSGNVNLPNRTDTLRKIMSYLKPDIFAGCEIQSEAGCDSILTRSLNVFGETSYQRAQFVSNSAGGDLQNMLFYNSAKLTLKEQRVIQVYPRDISHYILYLNDVTLPLHHDTCFVEVFVCHLKAGSTSSNISDRAQQLQTLVQVLETRPSNRHLVVCGDLNTYKSSEVGYQYLIGGTINPMKDPLNAPGNWTNNASFDYLHTQSPRSSGSMDCGVTGGLDDRFDHILLSHNAMLGSDSLKYVSNSYKAIGNDGNHYNQNILSGGNSMYPDSLVKALFYMSDHLPVKLDLQYKIPTNYGLNVTYSSNSSCTTSGATVQVTPQLGTAPYSYVWTPAVSTSDIASNLSAGSYCVQVTDALGIQDELCFEIGVVNPLSVQGFPGVDDGTCNGQVFVAIVGGAAPYTCSWNDSQNQTTETASNLCAGTYTCTVTDANGCQEVVSVVVSSETSGLTAEHDLAISVFPNPFLDELKVQIEGYTGKANVNVYQLSGEKIFGTESFISFNKNHVVLPVENLAKGVYLVEIRTISSVKILKVSK
ncbi:MAG TPA: T9SS type A sorting domain-containing protein [Fluviicola sp.]|nr:T9SS type A sorting domain-containing protein [Fluviicola sp.]